MLNFKDKSVGAPAVHYGNIPIFQTVDDACDWMDMDRSSNFAVPSVVEDDDEHFEACGKRFDDFEKSMNMEINYESRKELIASPAELRDDMPKAWLEDAIGHKIGGGVMDEDQVPRMPIVKCDNTHRKKI